MINNNNANNNNNNDARTTIAIVNNLSVMVLWKLACRLKLKT